VKNDLAKHVEGSSSDLICGALPEFGMKRRCGKIKKKLKPTIFEVVTAV
jgi:hypothetical protein